METTEINSISDLSQILQTLGEPEKGHIRFFRGHGDEGWQMLPSIYRETYLIENEDKIIKDALTYCPDDFLPSDTLFEKLVKLQHYGYSTRLLDLTTNALVALYFSAWNKGHHDKNGELIILDIPNEEIKYGDSDTVAILSAISLRNFLFNISKAIENADSDRLLKEYEYEKEKEKEFEEKITQEIVDEYKRGKRACRYWEYLPTAATIRKYKKIEGKKSFLLSFAKFSHSSFVKPISFKFLSNKEKVSDILYLISSLFISSSAVSLLKGYKCLISPNKFCIVLYNILSTYHFLFFYD